MSLHARTVNPSKGREQDLPRWLMNRIQFFEISLRPLLLTSDHEIDGCVLDVYI